MRLNIERQNKLEPQRVKHAIDCITQLGYNVTGTVTDKVINFEYKGHTVKFFPYSGWHTGKSINDGRGLKRLLDQIRM